MAIKRLYDYTDAELMELHEADKIDVLIDLECAAEGLPLLPSLPEKPEPIEVKPDLKAYCVKGMYFKTTEEANKVLEVLLSVNIYDDEKAPGGTYAQRVLGLIVPGSYCYPSIETKEFFSSEHWAANRKAIEAYNIAKDLYDKALTVYNEAKKERAKVTDEIAERLEDLYAKASRKSAAESYLARYLELSEGNRQIAKNFFKAGQPALYEEFGEALFPEDETIEDF